MQVIRSRGLRLLGYVACIGDGEVCTGF